MKSTWLAIAPGLILCTGAAVSADPASQQSAVPALVSPVQEGLGIPDGVMPERVRWNRLPLTISLPLNRERLVTFPGDVRVGFPPELTAQQLRTQIVDGTIYWTAVEAFPVRRVQVQSIATGEIYLVDLSASAEANNTAPVEVLGSQSKNPRQSQEAPQVHNCEAAKPESKPPDYAALTRMAAQHLYAPERLLKVLEGVHRAPVGRSATQALFHAADITAQPLIAWRAGGVYITAVKLSNRSFYDRVLDPRTMRGQWRTCTFQHARLYGRGDRNGRDVTAAYLISDRPFEESLHGR